MNTKNIEYCHGHCEKGRKASADFLNNNNSAYDAALDFMWFTDECFKTCLHKDKHTKESKLEEKINGADY